MEIRICKDKYTLGKSAAAHTAELLRRSIAIKGYARMILSTGASQFDTLDALTREELDWSRVTVFNLDEYKDMPETHPASFRRYLRERFISKIPALKNVFLTCADPDLLPPIIAELERDEIDVGLIGIGENTHIAFNDPPADFETHASFKVVKLDEACRRQQYGEGWFKTMDDVPTEAVTMTPYRIMSCKSIISAVPYAVKADAVYRVLTARETSPMTPASLLKEHGDFTLYIDMDSAAKVIHF